MWFTIFTEEGVNYKFPKATTKKYVFVSVTLKILNKNLDFASLKNSLTAIKKVNFIKNILFM